MFVACFRELPACRSAQPLSQTHPRLSHAHPVLRPMRGAMPPPNNHGRSHSHACHDAHETESLPRQQPSYPRQINTSPLLVCRAVWSVARQVVMPPSVSVLSPQPSSPGPGQHLRQRAIASTRSGSASARAGYDAAPSEPLHCGDEPRMTGICHRIFMERVDILCRKGWQGLHSKAVAVASTASGVSTPER